jgi:ribosomal protein S18 acetylase RimI-like enzyme
VKPTVRAASTSDAAAIARIHAASWRRHYRGAYSDTYLDGDLESERLQTWIERLARPEGRITLVADLGGRVLGFVHVRLDADRLWGTLIDNLHVLHDSRGLGIGTRLLRAAAQAIAADRSASTIYLWVQEQNAAAIGFYLSRGGRIAGRSPVPPPVGEPANLTGAPQMLRVVWADAAALEAHSDVSGAGSH